MSPTDETSAPESAASAEPDRWVGAVLGKYRLLRRLGRGGMGAVYEAEDTVLGRPVAVKILLPGLAEHGEAVARFQLEARAAARLNHPNVVMVHDVGEQGGTAFLVMERVQGESAQAHLQAHGPLPWREATQAIAAACRGLQAAHDAGLIHRDLKPANLMLLADGGAKLADFGLAKILEGAGAGITSSGSVLGTPHYMSPEQGNGETLDTRSDLYSLGATYFALLTGRPPYPGSVPLQVLNAHVSGPVPDPRDAQPGIPEACAAVVRRAMAKHPADRFASAAEMEAALEAVFGSTTVPTARTPSRAAVRAAPGTRVAAGLLAAGAVAALGFALTKQPGAERPANRAAEERAETAWREFAPSAWKRATWGQWEDARARVAQFAARPEHAPVAGRAAGLVRVLEQGRRAELAVSAALARDVGQTVRLETDRGEVIEGRVVAPPVAGRVQLATASGGRDLALLEMTAATCVRLARHGLEGEPGGDAALAILALAAGATADADALLARAESDAWPMRTDLESAAAGWPAPWSAAEVAKRRAGGGR